MPRLVKEFTGQSHSVLKGTLYSAWDKGGKSMININNITHINPDVLGIAFLYIWSLGKKINVKDYLTKKPVFNKGI